jgi:hypothetical protein
VLALNCDVEQESATRQIVPFELNILLESIEDVFGVVAREVRREDSVVNVPAMEVLMRCTNAHL